MNLATRCNGCGALFQVLRNQLWVSEGRVRCGNCSRVFNAYDQLYDLAQGKPPAWNPVDAVVPPMAAGQPTVTGSAEEPATVAASKEAADTAPGDEPGALVETDAEAVIKASDEGSSSDSPAVSGTSTDLPRLLPSAEQPDTPSTSELPAETPALLDPLLAVAAGADATPSIRESDAAQVESEQAAHARHELRADLDLQPTREVQPTAPWTSAPDTGVVPTPEFVRRAEMQALWNRPSMRLAVASLALVLSIVLMLQAGLHFRHRLAAESPQARRALSWLCTKLDCTIEAPRRIADLTVESSTLSRTAGDDRVIRLSLTLRNRGRIAVAMPAIDLSLKDGVGKVIVRRAIQPREVPAAPATLSPDVDVPLQLLVATDGRRIASYTVEIFYP